MWETVKVVREIREVGLCNKTNLVREWSVSKRCRG